MFFGFYGSPLVRRFLASTGKRLRPFPGTSPEKLAARQSQPAAYAASSGDPEGSTKRSSLAVLYIVAAEQDDGFSAWPLSR